MKKNNVIKKSALVLVTGLLFASLCACGSSEKTMTGYPEAIGNSYVKDGYYEEAEMAPSFSLNDSVGSFNKGNYSTSIKNTGTVTDESFIQRKVIKTASLTVQTLEYEDYINKLNDYIASFDGYIENSQQSGQKYDYYGDKYTNARNAYYTIRIPENRLADFLTCVGEMGTVISNNYNEQDISLTYVDTESRIKTLTQERDTLLKLMDNAKDINDVISLEARLSDVNYQLETYKSRLRGFDNQVNYSTVNISINEVNKITPVTPVQITWGQRIADGFKDGIERFTDGFQDFVVWLVSHVISLVVWVVIICSIIAFIIRKRNAKLRRKIEMKKAKRETRPDFEVDEEENKNRAD